jgi:hypothetical protein
MISMRGAGTKLEALPMSSVMIKCPNTGRSVSTAVETEPSGYWPLSTPSGQGWSLLNLGVVLFDLAQCAPITPSTKVA